MKALCPWASALLACALSATFAAAQPYCSPVLHVPLCIAPDACNPGFYYMAPNGVIYGPNYYLVPPSCPFNGAYKTTSLPAGQKLMAEKLGIPLGPNGQPLPGGGPPPYVGPGGFPTHPYVRGPRDFFMWRENMEDQVRRDQRPALVP